METVEMTDLLEAKYAEAEEAFIRKDVDVITDIMSPSFVAYMRDGEAKNRDEIMAGVREMLERVDVVSWARKIESMRDEGDAVVAVVAGDFKTVDKDGKASEIRLVNEDEWRRTEAGWLMTSSRSLRS